MVSMKCTHLQDDTKIRVVVIERSRFAAQLLCDAVARERQFIVTIGTVPINPESIAFIDVALVSANLEDDPLKGCAVARELLAARPALRVVILIEQPTREVVVESFRAGARGVFGQNDSVQALWKCIRSVNSGQIWANNMEIEYLLAAASQPVPVRVVDAKGVSLLSPREQDVVHAVGGGLTNREIADRLQLSEHTVKNHLFRIFDKLGISNRVELIMYVRSQLGPTGGIDGEITPVPPFSDDVVTASWCRDAARRFSGAAYRLGEMYRDGLGLPVDHVQSLMWFKIAEAISVEVLNKSKTAQHDVRKQLTAEQIAQAEASADEWLSSKPAVLHPLEELRGDFGTLRRNSRRSA
jgi:DNA-binding NarL/FixJ family response regulator